MRHFLLKLIVLFYFFTIHISLAQTTIEIPGIDKYIWYNWINSSYGSGNNILRAGLFDYQYRSYITWSNIRSYIPANVEISNTKFYIEWTGNSPNVDYLFFNYSGSIINDYNNIGSGTLLERLGSGTTNYSIQEVTELVQSIVNGNGNDIIRLGIKNIDGITNVLYNYNVNLRVTYTGVTVTQVDKNNQPFGQVGKWTGASWNNQNVPFSFYAVSYENVGLKSSQDFKAGTSEKFNNWTANNDLVTFNPNNFVIQPGSNIYTAKFLQAYENVEIKNNFSEIPGFNPSGDDIYFADPWLNDYPSQYQNTNTNQGISAPYKERLSPFFPNFSTNYSGDIYKGVFLNQVPDPNNPDKPYYSVKSELQSIYLNETGRMHYFYFHNWSGTDVSFQNLYDYQSGVVFASGNAVVQANLKGQGLSNNTEAYTNHQRKAVRLENSNHLMSVYKSLNKIWLEQSNDNGSTWFLKNGGTPLDNDDQYNELSTPSIDYIPAIGGAHPFAAVLHNALKLSIVKCLPPPLL